MYAAAVLLLCCRYRNNATATGDSIHTWTALAVDPTLLTVGFPAADKMLRNTLDYSLRYHTTTHNISQATALRRLTDRSGAPRNQCTFSTGPAGCTEYSKEVCRYST